MFISCGKLPHPHTNRWVGGSGLSINRGARTRFYVIFFLLHTCDPRCIGDGLYGFSAHFSRSITLRDKHSRSWFAAFLVGFVWSPIPPNRARLPKDVVCKRQIKRKTCAFLLLRYIELADGPAAWLLKLCVCTTSLYVLITLIGSKLHNLNIYLAAFWRLEKCVINFPTGKFE